MQRSSTRFYQPTEQDLRNWYQTEIGRLLARQEAAQCVLHCPRFTGLYALQLGPPGYDFWMERSVIRDCFYIRPEHMFDPFYDVLTGEYQNLPIRSESVDLVCLPHTLEVVSSPEQVLQEAARVLVPSGYLLILGFNPFGAWHLYQKLFGEAHPLPRKLCSAKRIRHALAESGCEEVLYKTFFFRPPCRTRRWLQALLFLEQLGQQFYPALGAEYILLFKKHKTPLTPVRPLWRRRQLALRKRFAGPAARKESL